MSRTIAVHVPDLGEFKDVPVIEVLVKPGDAVQREDPLITLESDKATMDVPSPHAGRVSEVKVKVGDRVSKGTPILTLEIEAEERAQAGAAPALEKAGSGTASGAREHRAPERAPERLEPAAAPPVSAPKADLHGEVVVIGAGPGGYTAAFRAADLGKKVVLIERYPTLGGVCLNVGCIPSKALLHVARVLAEAEEVARAGIEFGKPNVKLEKLRAWKAGVVGRLTKGLAGLARQRGVEVVQGRARFASARLLRVETPNGAKTVSFDHCIVAAGSSAAKIPGFPEDERIFDSTGALELARVPKRLLVVGGGIIGLEMATVYDALGAKVTVVEMMDALLPGLDADVVRPLARRLERRYERILLKTKVARIEPRGDGLRVSYEGEGAPGPELFDAVLVAVGRRPNGREIAAEAAGVHVDERGYIPVDGQLRTNVAHIHAIGDICGEPMLAHKASHEGKIAAEAIAGHKAYFDARTVPCVAYTDPEVAWAGLTENEARRRGIEYEKAVFPWAASGRAIAMDRDEGLTKLLFEKSSRRLLGAAIVGVNAGELVSETVLALEMGADAADLALTIHPHPTLSETVFFAAEVAEGTITDLYLPRGR